MTESDNKKITMRGFSNLEKKGRKGDKFLAHLTPGEIVIPRPFAEDDDFRAIINEFFKDNNVDLEKFIVGSGKNSINPETGNMEFGFFSKINPFKRGSFFRQVFDPALKRALALPKKLKGALFPEIETPPSLPVTAAAATKTAAVAPSGQLSEAAIRNRRRRMARFQPRGFGPPSLGQPGLLGVSG